LGFEVLVEEELDELEEEVKPAALEVADDKMALAETDPADKAELREELTLATDEVMAPVMLAAAVPVAVVAPAVAPDEAQVVVPAPTVAEPEKF